MTMGRLVTYLAMDRRCGLVEGVEPPSRFNGSALLADISGFTPLTEALVDRLGPRRGAEELTKLLNTVYTDLVSRVHHFGGSVVCFIGDALIACFPDDSGLRAIASGMQMQRVMKQFQGMPAPHGGRVNLAMKAAVAVGPMRRFLVGDPLIRRIDVLAGQTIDRLSDAEHVAKPGDVVTSHDVVRRLGNALFIDEWRGRIGVIAGLRERASTVEQEAFDGIADLTPDMLESFLLTPVYQRVSAGQGDFLSELRPVAAIFLKFDGIDYDEDDSAGEKLHAYTAWVQSEVHRYGGDVLLLTTADKGSHLYAVFGALEAHEDDCQRAVAAAQALLDVPEELDYVSGIQIGVSYGRARVGAYGGETRQTYGALGDVVNLAARLMGIAPVGEIRCSESVFEHSKTRWEYEALEAVQLKGMSQPQSVYRPIRRSLAVKRDAESALVGREDELGALVAALEEARSGSRQIQVIEGEAGIGKSRLVDELVRVAKDEGFTCLLGAGDSIEQHAPYRAWRDILTVFFELEAGMTDEARKDRVLRRIVELDSTSVDRAPLLNDILGLELPESVPTRSYVPEVRQASLAALIGDLFVQHSQLQPILLVLDDAHWLDSLSWELAVSIARSVAHSPVLVLLSHRPFGELEPTELLTIASLSNAHRLPLGTLPRDGILILAASQAGVLPTALPEAVSDLLADRANGNPLYAREFINALLDSGRILVAGGECVVTGDPNDLQESVPSTLEGIVLTRLDRLLSEEQLTLRVASVIGRSFLLRALRNVYPSPVEGDELLRHLDSTTRRHLTVLEYEIPEPDYAFEHVITQQVAYDTLLFEQRRELHRSVAEWYERAYSENLAPHYPLLVFHWNRAEHVEYECRYCQLTGQQAAGQYANIEAEMYLTRALQLLDQMGEDARSERRFDVLQQRAHVHAILGRVDEERTDLEVLLSIAETSEDASKRGEVLVDWADLHNRCGQFEQALKCGEEALDVLRNAGSPEGEARALTKIAKTFEGQGDFSEARDNVERALSIFFGSGVVDGQANSLKSLGIISTRLGELPQAMERFEAARALYRQIGDRKGEADILGNLGALSYYLGDYEATIRYTEQAQPMFEDMGNRSGSAACLGNLGSSYSALGAFGEALRHHERGLAIYRQLEAASDCADSYSDMGTAYHALGVGGYPELSAETHEEDDNLKKAIHCHSEALEIRERIGSKNGEATSHFNLGSVYSCLGDAERAEMHLQQALRMAREIGLDAVAMRTLAALARVSLHTGDAETALARSSAAIDELGDQELPDADEIHFTQYLVLLAARRDESAQRHLKLATDSILSKSQAIGDVDLRNKFLAMYHEVLTAWSNRRATSSG